MVVQSLLLSEAIYSSKVQLLISLESCASCAIVMLFPIIEVSLYSNVKKSLLFTMESVPVSYSMML